MIKDTCSPILYESLIVAFKCNHNNTSLKILNLLEEVHKCCKSNEHNNIQHNIYHTKMKICIFGSSSPRTNEKYLSAAYNLGQEIARLNHICVNGAGLHGCMGAVNRGMRSCQGKIIGVSHEMFRGGDSEIEEKIVCYIFLTYNLLTRE